MPSIAFDGRRVPYTLKRSMRARTWRLQIGAGTGLQVILPQRFDERRLPPILRARRRWILRTLDWAATLPLPLAHDGRGEGHTVLYRGEPLALAVQVQPDRVSSVAQLDHTLTVRVRRQDGALIRRAVRRWCKAQADALIPPRVAELAAPLGLRFRSVAIADQRTRWGSCSRTGRLRFNWRLVLAPPAVLDYVIIHELSHLQAPNHSAQFWRLVASACPSYAAHRAWLRQNSRKLYI